MMQLRTYAEFFGISFQEVLGERNGWIHSGLREHRKDCAAALQQRITAYWFPNLFRFRTIWDRGRW